MLDELKPLYDKLQLKYGDKNLDSIYNGGYTNNPDICFVFMNPTGRNIASSKEWHGLKSPWIGTKNIWNLFYKIGLLDEDIYNEIRQRTGPSWTEEFASCVYDNVIKIETIMKDKTIKCLRNKDYNFIKKINEKFIK